MKLARAAMALFAVALVAGVIIVISSETNLLVTTRTERFTTIVTTDVTVISGVNHTVTVTVYSNVEMIGTCTAVSYFAPDTSVAGQNMTTTIGTSTYSTSTYENYTVGFAITSTSQNLNDRPSDGWTVTVCTLSP